MVKFIKATKLKKNSSMRQLDRDEDWIKNLLLYDFEDRAIEFEMK